MKEKKKRCMRMNVTETKRMARTIMIQTIDKLMIKYFSEVKFLKSNTLSSIFFKALKRNLQNAATTSQP